MFVWNLLSESGNRWTAVDHRRADAATQFTFALDREYRRGLRVLVLGIGALSLWASLVPLSAAVTAPGTLVVQSSVKKIQHPTGGVVAEIVATDGMHVKKGDLLVRLDATQVRANLRVVKQQLDEAEARTIRLVAERDGTDDLKSAPENAALDRTSDFEQLIISERSLFKARASARQGQKEMLHNRIDQFSEEIAGLEAQIKSKNEQIEFVNTELQGVETLYDKKLVPLARLTTLQREAARLRGDRAQMQSSIAETKSKISEASLQVMQIDQEFRTEVMKDLRQTQDKKAELAQKIVAAQDQLDRIDIRAPTDGVVQQLSVHTIAGVIEPAATIMEIVPDFDALQIELQLHPNDIDSVQIGQRTKIRLSAFDRTTPELNGMVSYISADLNHDKQTNAAYYTVRVELPAQEVGRLGKLQLVSGMPAEVFLQTGRRTMLSYLTKPIRDQWERAFTER
jgi:HlyD family secretion protein